MSARQLFLANLASRRFDEFDSDGSSADDDDDDSDASDDIVVGMNDDSSLADHLLKVTPPRYAVSETRSLFRDKSPSSQICVNNAETESKSKPTLTEAERKPTIAVIPQVPSSPLMRRAESFRRKASDRQENKVDKTHPNKPTRHVRSFSHDINARRTVNRKSLSTSSSFTEMNDELTAVTSTISVASINAALSMTIPNKNNIIQTRREHLPRCPTTGGSIAMVATSKSFTMRSDLDDTSTEATEAITSFSGSLSLSNSKSFESSTSKSSASKELERLKRLSIGGIKRNNNIYDTKEVIIGGYEMQVDMSRSDISEKSSEGSSVMESRGRDLDRMKKFAQKNSSISEQTSIKPGRMSLKELKSRRYGGNDSVTRERERLPGGVKSSTSFSFSAEKLSPSMTLQPSPSATMGNKSNNSVVSRTELRRSRSASRNSNVTLKSSSSERASSTPRMAPNSPPKSTLNSTPPPPNVLDRRAKIMMTPPRTNAVSNIPSAPLSPLMKSSHKYHRNVLSQSPHIGPRQRSRSPALQNACTRGSLIGQELSPKPESIFQVLKPSKLASLSISVLNKAVLPIQTLARSYIAKLTINDRRKNIVVLQSLIRRWLCLRYYKSASTIALTFQAAYRGMVTRDQLDFRHYCASRIQATFRGYVGSMNFIEILKNIILIQSLLRMICQRNKYLAIVEEMHFQLAAKQIQSYFRRYLAQTEFLMDVSDVVVCQSTVRRFLAKNFYTKMKCAIVIQATWRRFLASEYYILTLSDVIVCQSIVRRWIGVTNYNYILARRETAAISIQKVHRGFIKRMKYLTLVADIVTIQSLVRRRIATKALSMLQQIQWYRKTEQEVAATKIQAAYHGFIARMDFIIVIGHVISLQSVVRSTIAKNKLHALRKCNNAATKIRAAYMGFITRMNYLITLDSIITCQCAIRAMYAKRQLNEARFMKWREENAAATKIQCSYRRHAARFEYIIIVSSIITCQSAIRMLLAKVELVERRQVQCNKEYSAATLIKAAYLGFTARMNYILTVADIVTIQKYVRGHQARTWVNELVLKKRMEQITAANLRKSQEHAAITIQKVFRGFVAYEVAILSLANAIYIQANIRKYLAKLELIRLRKLRVTHQSASRIQSIWRSHKAQTNYALVIYGIISIQAIHRRNLVITKHQNGQALRASAAVILQSYVRRCLVIGRLHRLCEVRALRGAVGLMNSEHASCTVIQNRWKEYLLQRNIARRLCLENNAAIAIQKCFRGYRDCLQFVMMSFSVIQIQSVARSYRAKLHLKRLKQEREVSERKRDSAAIVIQSSFRGYRDFVRFVLIQYFIIKIQSCARSYNARQLLKHHLKQDEDKKRKVLEKTAALMIERFFIKIKAEIELEIARLASKKAPEQKLRKIDKVTRRTWQQSNPKRNVSSKSSDVTTVAPSQFHPSSNSYLSANSVMSGDLDAHIMRGTSHGRRRMSSYQSVTKNNTSSFHVEKRVIDHYPPHNNSMRYGAPSRDNLIRSEGNEGLIAHHHAALFGGHDMTHAYPIRRDMRSASPTREQAMTMQNSGHYQTNACTSEYHRVPSPFQPGYAPQNANSSETGAHGGHGMWAPSLSYNGRHPSIHPPFCNGNIPQSHGHQMYQDANIQQSNSFSSAFHQDQMQNQYYSTSNHLVATNLESQTRLSPVPQTNYLAGVPNRSHHYLSLPPVANTYPGHQRYSQMQDR